MDEDQRVLSIQSHVVSGYVGNKSATFPLQILGFEVDAINSVQFSNHTGYGHWKGQELSESDLSDLLQGLTNNDLHQLYSHLLTGYVRSSGFLLKICSLVKQLKQANPSLKYVCDPVMGDNGKMYVPADLLPVYQQHIIPLADIITPNQYELELLTERSIETIEDAIKAIDMIHDMGVKTVVVSSTELGAENMLICIGSSKQGNKRKMYKVEIPKFPATFTGTGDLFAALFLAWFHKTKGDLKITLENVIGTMQALLKRTFQVAMKKTSAHLTVSSLELKLIQSKSDIENPTCNVVAEILDE